MQMCQASPPEKPCMILGVFYSDFCRVSLAEYLLVLRVYFPTCHRWYCIPWVLQELLLSRRGRGVRPWARLFYVISSRMLLLDLITNWHVIEQVCVMMVLKLYCFRYYFTELDRVVITLIVLWCMAIYLWTLCNMWLVCWIMYDLGCMLDYSRSFMILDGIPGLYGLKYDSAIALVVAIVLVLL